MFDAFIAVILAPLPLNALALTVDANVATPATFTLSKFVCPSTSISALTSIFPLNVEIPDTSNLFTLN